MLRDRLRAAGVGHGRWESRLTRVRALVVGACMLGGWPVPAAAQTRWITTRSGGDVIQIDSTRFVATKPIYRSWVRIQYQRPRVLANGKDREAYELWDVAVNCSAKHFRAFEVLKYDSVGSVLQELDSLDIGAWQDPVPDSYGEAVTLDFCQSVPLLDGSYARQMSAYFAESAVADSVLADECRTERDAVRSKWCVAWRAGFPLGTTPAAMAKYRAWQVVRDELDSAFTIARPPLPSPPGGG